MRITPFRSEKDLVARFIDVAHTLRHGDPSWVPPFRAQTEAAFSDANPFLLRGQLCGFLAEEAGRDVGRCAAIFDPELRIDGEPVGQIGFYECDRSTETSKALLDVAMAWLKERGVRRVIGPMNFSIWNAYRFMTRGFDRDVFLGEPRNPQHYPDQWAASGFASHARYFSWDLTEEHLRGMHAYAKHAADPGALEAQRLTHRPLDLERFDEQVVDIHRLLVDAFRENAAFSAVGLDEFRELFGGVRSLVVPELVPLVWTEQRAAVGFGYLVPDYAEAIRKMNGETGLMAKAKFLMAKGRPDRLVFHTVAIQKEYRRKGMVETVLADLLDFALSHGFTRGVGALAKEGPTMYSKTGPPSREYTLFSRTL